MSKIGKLLVFLVQAIVAGLALAFVVVYLWPAALEDPAGPPQQTPPIAPSATSFADAVDRAGPAVVSIYTRTVVAPVTDGGSMLNRMRLRAISNQGSGVIMRDDGYIITNHHVVNRVSTINVALWDNRIVPARVVGSDPATDLAVLKVDLADLPVATVREGDPISVGDVVLAIGNALGFSHTVTMGIVSATGRNVGSARMFEDFIQTDAAINAGNSGGALVDTEGQLVGINTRTGDDKVDSKNIGFAIPVSLATNVMEQIIDYGSVRRGWLGAAFGNLPLRLLPDGSAMRIGIGVRDVPRDSPAWKAGIRQGDVILSLDGEQVFDAARFMLSIAQRVPGSQVELLIERGSETFETYATLIQQPPL